MPPARSQGAQTRRYHALLLTARNQPNERFVLVNHLEEWLDIDGQVIPLSTNLYPGAVHPAGYEHCIEFSTDPWPTWSFDCNGITVQREILSIQGRDIVIVRWKLVGKKHSRVVLRVRPKLTGRDYHGTHHKNGHLSTEAQVESGMVVWHPHSDCFWCGPSPQECIAMNHGGIGTYNPPSNSNADSMLKKTGGRPESSRSTLSPDPSGRWPLPARPSTDSMSSPLQSTRRFAATQSGKPHQPLILWPANSGVLRKCTFPSKGRRHVHLAVRPLSGHRPIGCGLAGHCHLRRARV